MSSAFDGTARALNLQLRWIRPEEVMPATAVFRARDTATRGNWKGCFGEQARWIPAVTGTEPQNGYAVAVRGQPFTWNPGVSDARVPEPPEGASPPLRRSTCWFGSPVLSLDVTPPDRTPYQLTVYVLDFDRHGRQMEVTVADDRETIDSQEVSNDAAGKGIYLSWTVTGPVRLQSRAVRGQNSVISAVFIDPE